MAQSPASAALRAATPGGPEGVRFADRLYLFVRGTDNGIYTTVRTRR